MFNSKITEMQYKTFETSKPVTVDGETFRRVVACVRFDDQCGNGHNSFSITGDAWLKGSRRKDPDVCGCIHEIIAEAFPELKPFLKYHLCSTDSPMHYIANTLYHARTCSHKGKKAGDPVKFKKQILFDGTQYPKMLGNKFLSFLSSSDIYALEKVAIEHKRDSDYDYDFKPHYTFNGYDCEWHQCPFDSESEIDFFIMLVKNISYEIKTVPIEFATEVKPDIEAARRSAVWPEATLEQLQDRETLEKRLPSLVAKMKADIESLGFTW